MAQKFLKVKNFEDFQHYKDRTPPWIKLYNDVLENYEFSCLSDASRFHLVAIWLLASRTNNRIPANEAWIAMRIGASERVTLEPLIEHGFLVEFIEENQQQQKAEHHASAVLASGKQLARESRAEQSRAEQSRFAQFWSAYPKKKNKGHAEKAWRKISPDESLFAEIMSSLSLAKQAHDWKKDNGQFIPYPASWLNAKGWEDEHHEQTPPRIPYGASAI